ncbi:hypothetical protein IWQ56_004641 [Coemansia nantahalensis]|uniref:Uncharacterized protein n=1 Tax=Coemansia helicoidea TaxID=1286919 RepID=A0ACC1LFG6_9FUNG|nr:hypothetical protein IWQ56_004641 [Coemansia nantahalensis]KAJ2807410.1 hypothetical protein H4R21_000491 [Coemansia helicoidea]
MSKLAADILTRGGVLPPTLAFAVKPKTLYELLNVQRLNAYKFKAAPDHWYSKGFEGCYYEIHKVKYRLYQGEPTHGKAWGIQYWNGEAKDKQPKEIHGGLKFSWREYDSPNANGIVYNREEARKVERRRVVRLKKHLEATGESA